MKDICLDKGKINGTASRSAYRSTLRLACTGETRVRYTLNIRDASQGSPNTN